MSGGSGLLGKAIKSIDPTIITPSHSEMDILDLESLEKNIIEYKPDTFLHAAAFTSPPKINENPQQALQTNIIGTANVVSMCMKYNIRLVYISTDYVFKGDKGNYAEDDELLPQNKYAWSKLGGECAVKLHDNALIIRTSFTPDLFPYEKAFRDQFTSRDLVSVIAPMILKLTQTNENGVIHAGSPRRSVLEVAQLTKPEVESISINDISFTVPKDTSFNLTKLNSL